MELGLSDKVALVTGGSRGIGRATALSLAREGCQVAICGRKEDTLNSAMDQLSAITPHVWGTTADVAKLEDVERFVSGAADNLDLFVKTPRQPGARWG